MPTELPRQGRLADKVVAMTGATGGLGLATARLMAREGAKLALTDIDEEALDILKTDLIVEGTEVVAVPGDATQPETHAALVSMAMERFGALHAWCNIAGILGPGDLADVTLAQFDRVMHVNCFSQLIAIQQAAPAIRDSGGGAIVNVSSVGGLVSLPHMSAYCASKAAIIGMTRALAAELAPDIRCNVICPGGIDTGMAQGLLAGLPPEDRADLLAKLTGRQHLKRFAHPFEIAKTILHLASDESSFMTGSVIAADGGHTSW